MINKVVGKEGEEKAAHYLGKKGYQILEKNYRWGRGEIDIICKERNRIIFVEVKTRKNLNFGDPVEAVDRRKQRQIVKIAERYLVEKRLYDKIDCRFDVITLIENKIEHIEDAFRVE
ncbi:YraN family protein [candidate division TA06 bacterium]|nr:YraN family protein [candidate division TA06 bacterium]